MLSSDGISRGPRGTFRGTRRTAPSSLAQPPQANTKQTLTSNQAVGERGKSKKALLLAVLASVLIIGSLGSASFFAWKYFNDQTSEGELETETSARIVEKVGKLFELPQDEEPTVAQIQYKNKLKDQNFFDKAQNGDYMLVYEKAKTVLIYRESSNKVINAGPINVPQEEPTESQGSVSGETTP